MGGRTFECLDAVINRYIYIYISGINILAWKILSITIILFRHIFIISQISEGTNRRGAYFGSSDGNRT